jgi:Domain of unknown function (DUF4386)
MTEPMTEQRREASPRRKARMAGAFYLLTFLTGTPALFLNGRLAIALGLVAGACYVAETILLYALFKRVNKRLSFFAACTSLVGCAFGPVRALLHFDFAINPLVFFGFYCLLIGYLIFGSTFLPRILGVLMAFAGLGWLTFLSPPLANHLSPYIFAPGLLGEGALTLWLLAKGVNAERWQEHWGL